MTFGNMAAMVTFPPFPNGATLLLSAGARAGKSSLLAHWRSTLTGPLAYLALTPEDIEVAFFRYRLLQPWPEIQARYDELAARLPSSWGALLGMAIAETHPDFTLLLDDLHGVEATPLHAELLALCRHLPATGRLAITSRHQIPPIAGRTATLLGPDHAHWHERPDSADLLALPDELVRMALVLHLLGEANPSEDGRELIRRNVAMLGDDSRLHMRAPWEVAAEEALALAPLQGLWDRLEEPIESFRRQHYRSREERRLVEMLDKIPAAVREQHPYFLQLQGDLCLDDGKFDRARNCYQQVLSLMPDRPDLLIGLARVAARSGDWDEGRSLLARLEALAFVPTPLQQARLGNLRGQDCWVMGETEAAKATLHEVLSIPTVGDRCLAFERLSALSLLAKIHTDLEEAKPTEHYFGQAISVATEHHLQRDLLPAHMARLSWLQTSDEKNAFSIRQILEVPNDCFAYLSTVSCYHLLYSLGIRAYYVGEPSLSVRYFSWAKRFAASDGLAKLENVTNVALLSAYASLQRVEDAQRAYEEIRAAGFLLAPRHIVLLAWVQALLASKQFQEAEALLEKELDSPYPEPVQTSMRFHLLHARHLQGDAGALKEIRALLESEAGSALGRREPRLLESLGLREAPPRYRIHAFGALDFQDGDQPPVNWARKKPLALLGHMVLHPAGIASERLAEELFGDPDDLESLHTCAYRLRQGLKEAGASDLVESFRGVYRLRWDQIAFCDLQDFEALYSKARSLEAEGLLHGAALLYGMALLVMQGPLIANLPKEFEAERAHYMALGERARDFLRAHPFPTIDDGTECS